MQVNVSSSDHSSRGDIHPGLKALVWLYLFIITLIDSIDKYPDTEDPQVDVDNTSIGGFCCLGTSRC